MLQYVEFPHHGTYFLDLANKVRRIYDVANILNYLAIHQLLS